MGKILDFIRWLVGLVRSLIARARGVDVLVGVERINQVLSHFEDDITALGTGLGEMSDECSCIIQEQRELECQRAELDGAQARAKKLLEGLNALLGV